MDVLRGESPIDHWHVYPLGYRPIRLTELLHVCIGGFLWNATLFGWRLYFDDTLTMFNLLTQFLKLYMKIDGRNYYFPFRKGIFVKCNRWVGSNPRAPGFQWQMSRFRLGFPLLKTVSCHPGEWWDYILGGVGRWCHGHRRWLLGEKLIVAVPGWIFGSMKTFGFFFEMKIQELWYWGKQIGVFCWW